jgi:hypothetical protein
MENHYNSETGCCPRFDPNPWDEKEHTWQQKTFIKDRVCAFFHIPLNFGKVVVRNMEKIEQAQAFTPQPPVFLCDESSPWKTDLYIETSKSIPGAQMASISGTFLTKVFEGPYKQAPQWYKKMAEFVKSRGKEAKKIYAYYTTCPNCAKHYGKNYVVLAAQI